jgi:hypothetical protein
MQKQIKSSNREKNNKILLNLFFLLRMTRVESRQ